MEKLNNGAAVIEETRVNTDERIVLAMWDRGDGKAEYVTWSVSNSGDAYSGHYFATVSEANYDYGFRAGRRAAERAAERKGA